MYTSFKIEATRAEGVQLKKSKSQAIFENLRDAILVNRLKPGEMLGEVALAEKFGVSRTPVRQALQYLASQGLVEIRDGAGTFVTPIDREGMKNAYQIRITMEKLALETSVYHIESEELDAFRNRFQDFLAQLEKLGNHDGEITFEEMAFAEWELHDLIVERSENNLIGPALESITAIMRRYQITYISGYLRAAREHLGLIERIREKDVAGAQAILDEHLRVRTAWKPVDSLSA